MNASIAIDGNEANVELRVGTGQYAFQIMKRWADTDSSHSFQIYLRDKPLPHMPKSSLNWQYHVIGPKKAWTRFALPLNLVFMGRKHDVFWNPAHYLPPVTWSSSVVTIHDLAYEFFPELFLKQDLYKLKTWTRSSIKHANKVIAVSQATKDDIVKLYGTEKDKIEVIHNGYDAEFFNVDSKIDSSVLDRYGLHKNGYILFMGTLQPRKNVVRLVQAYRLLKDSGFKGKLVIAGKIGWMADSTLEALENSEDKDDILMTGYISDKERLALYRNASVFALPSLYEGFGVPVLEAMACGCPVAASNNSALTEVVGDAGVLFNPTDPVDIKDKIVDLMSERESYVRKGMEHVKNFSWDLCAKNTLDCLLKTVRSS